jgi:hypothetical protein
MYPPFTINQTDDVEGEITLIADEFAVKVPSISVAKLIKESVLLRPQDSAKPITPPAAAEDKRTKFTLILRPTGDGAWTDLGGPGGWANVDEEVADEDATYNGGPYTSSSGQDEYAITVPADLPTYPIESVTVFARSRRVSGVATQYVFVYPSVNGQGPGILPGFVLTDEYATYGTPEVTNPDSGVAWKWSDLANLQLGVLHGAGLFQSGNARTTQVWAEVTYRVAVRAVEKCNAG